MSMTRSSRKMLVRLVNSIFKMIPGRVARDLALACVLNSVFAWREMGDRMRHYPYGLHKSRFTRKEVIKVVETIRRRFPNANIWLMSDNRNLSIPCIKRIECVTQIQDKQAQNVFVLVYQSDEQMRRVLGEIRSLPDAFYFTPSSAFPPANYFHQKDLVKEVLIDEAALPLGKFDLSDFENLLQMVEITRNVNGDYVEIGVYQGRSSHCILEYMRRAGIPKTVYCMDVYEGFNYEAAEHSQDAVWFGSHTETSVARVKEFLKLYPNAEVIKLDIIGSHLPEKIGPIALCNIDVDMYEAVEAALKKVSPRISSGGFIVVEDAGHTPYLAGANLATMEFMKSDLGAAFIPIYMQSGQYLFVRR